MGPPRCTLYPQVCAVCGEPTSDVLVFRQAGDAEQVSALRPAGGPGLAPGHDGVQVELVAGLQLLVRLPERLTAGVCPVGEHVMGKRLDECVCVCVCVCACMCVCVCV